MPSSDSFSASGDWTREAEYLAGRLRHLGSNFESSYRQLSSFRRVLEQINRGFHLEEIAEYLYDAFREVIPYDRIGLALIDEQGARVTARWARSEASVVRLRVGFSAALEGSSLQDILATGEPRILDDLEEYLREHPGSESTRLIVREGVRSSLTCPLLAESRPVGFLFFSSMQKNAYRGAHVEIFKQIAGTLSVTLEKAQLYDRMAGLNRSLEENVQALEAANEQIELLMLTDELTGVANRRALSESLREAVAVSETSGQPLSILMLDLDHFKSVNDVHGHEAGDSVLREAAARMRASCRAGDFVARFGGEEFIVLLPGTEAGAAAVQAERVRAELAAEPYLGGELVVTASVGVAQLRAGEDSDGLLRRVDERMYEAKARGRNRVVSRAA